MSHIQHAHYGKADVRVTKVIRHESRHDLLEYCVRIQLQGDFDRCYTDGDNSLVVATDTMKNTVYALARRHVFDSPETFGRLLAGHFIDRFTHVSAAEVEIEAATWERIEVRGREHDHAFESRPEVRLARIRQLRDQPIQHQGGIDRLQILKTTRSGFVGFPRDEYTTLEETADRIFATTVLAWWDFSTDRVDYNQTFAQARAAIVEAFAEHDSLAVQQTIHAIGSQVLQRIPAISRIAITMPNQHRLLVNLKPFGLDNPNSVFVATSEPYGLIHATISRDEP